jgi:hypothetical protein
VVSVKAIDAMALRLGHSSEHFSRAQAVLVSAFACVRDAEVGMRLFDIAIVGNDVQAASGAVSLVDGSHQRQHVGNLGSIGGLIDSHAEILA